jgi:hypothetical protein
MSKIVLFGGAIMFAVCALLATSANAGVLPSDAAALKKAQSIGPVSVEPVRLARGGRVAGGHRGAAVGHRGVAVGHRAVAVRHRGVAVGRRGTVVITRRWVRRPYYGRVIAGVTLGTIIAAGAVGVAPSSPGSNLCWYWSNPEGSRGYWDYCQ